MMNLFHRDDELEMRLFYVLAWTAMIANTIGYVSNAILYGWTPSTLFSFGCAVIMYNAGIAGFVLYKPGFPALLILVVCCFVGFSVMYCVYGSDRIYVPGTCGNSAFSWESLARDRCRYRNYIGCGARDLP